MRFLSRVMLFWTLAALTLLPVSQAQDAAQPAPFKTEEIEQLVAPIALYPDALVAQILMASTYPLEVVEAARWAKANPDVKDKALEDAMQKQKWDPSVKSLTAFPTVLAGMNEKLELTQKLGDAFLGQQKEVMAAIQRLRSKADKAGNLKSSKEQTVTTTQEGGETVIKIEPADPQVVYVPSYNPAVVYGPWPYPAYPPYYYYPYPPGAALFTFTVGVAIGNALWGGCHWGGGGGVYINHNTYNNFNKTNIKSGDWNHNAEHRKGVGYRDQASQQKFGGGQRAGVDSREQFRGRAEQGRQEISRGAADSVKRDAGAGSRAGDRSAGVSDRAGGAGDRSAGVSDRAGGVGDRSPGVSDRSGGLGDRGGSRQAGGFDGIGSGGHTRDASSRGASSRASAGASRAGGARAGGGGRRR